MSAWTTERPTVAGWYWWTNEDIAPVICQVRNGRAYFEGGGSFTAEKLGGRWQGPITPQD